MRALLLWIVCMSIIAFVCYGIDKKKAMNHAWRIRESTLILLAFLGGAPGAYLGMHFFHHKTKHMKFRILVPLALILWIFIAACLYELVQ